MASSLCRDQVKVDVARNAGYDLSPVYQDNLYFLACRGEVVKLQGSIAHRGEYITLSWGHPRSMPGGNVKALCCVGSGEQSRVVGMATFADLVVVLFVFAS